MQVHDTKVADTTAVLSLFTWIGIHLADVHLVIQCIAGLATTAAMVWAALANRAKAKAYREWHR